MPVYFDSSAVLSFILQQSEGRRAIECWEGAASRCSSILLKAECLVSLRRLAARGTQAHPQAWLAERLTFLLGSLAEINLKEVDVSVLDVLEREAALSECRTLDALHLATALYMREHSSEAFQLVTFDDQMRQTALKLDLEVLPP